MSMIGNFARVSVETLESLHRDPSQIMGLLYPEDEEGGIAEGDAIDLDKAWHALHFIFAGDPWEGEFPAGFMFCGKPVGDVDVGYGPATSHTPEEVVAIDAYLQGIDDETVRAGLDPEKMGAAEIYPHFWDRFDPEEGCDYFAEYFHMLKDFIRETAERRMALLLWVN